MICKTCNCVVDESLFSICPFCGTVLDQASITEQKSPEKIMPETSIIETIIEKVQDYNTDDLTEISSEKPMTSADIAVDVHELFLRSIPINQVGLHSKKTIQEISVMGIQTAYDLLHTTFRSRKFTSAVIEDISNACKEIKNQLDIIDICHISADSDFGIYHPIVFTNKVMEYLESKKIKDVKELCIFINTHDFLDIIQYFECDQFKKVLANIEKYSDYCVANFILSSLTEKIGFSKISETPGTISIDAFKSLGLASMTVTYLKSKGYSTVTELRDFHPLHLPDLFYKSSADGLLKLFNIIHQFINPDLPVLFQKVFDNIPQDRINVVLQRDSGETLDAIGNKKGITRERVRQKEEFVISVLEWCRDFFSSYFLRHRKYFRQSDIVDMIGKNKYSSILIYTFKMDDRFEYLPYAQVFLPADPSEKRKTDKFISNLISQEMGDGLVNVVDKCDELEDIFHTNNIDYMGFDELISFFEFKNYYVQGEYVSKSSITKEKVIELLVRNYFPHGIKTSQGEDYVEDLAILRELMNVKFGIKIEGISNHNISSLISRAGTILAGKGLYISKENVSLDFSVLDAIYDYMQTNIENSMDYSQLFDIFKGRLSMLTPIDNYEFLHGILKEFYPEGFNYRKTCIVREGTEKSEKNLRMIDCLYSILKKEQDPVSVSYLLEKLGGYTKFTLIQTMGYANDISHCGNQMYVMSSYFQLSEEEEDKLISWVEEQLDYNYGYCSLGLLLENIQNNHPEFINNHPLKNQFYLENYIKMCRKEKTFECSRPHIVKKGLIKGEINTKSIIDLQFCDKKINSRQISNLINKYKLSSMAVEVAIKEYLSEKYIQINQTDFLPKSSFSISKENLEEIINYLDTHIENNYFSLLLNHNYASLPYIDYEWNNYLLRSIISIYLHTSYKELKLKEYKRNNTSCIIIKAEYPCKDYVSFVIKYVVEQTGKRIIDMYDLLTLLQIKGLAGDQLSESFFESDLVEYNEKNSTITFKYI